MAKQADGLVWAMEQKKGRRGPGKFTGVRHWARKQIIVNARYQYRTLIPVAVTAVAASIFLYALVIFPLGRAVSVEPDIVFRAILTEQLTQLQVRLWPVVILAAAIGGAYALLASHRVAGPLFNLNRILGKLALGKTVNRVKFRAGDEFREFEGVTTKLAEKVKDLQTHEANTHMLVLQLEQNLKELRDRCADENVTKESFLSELDWLRQKLSGAADEARKKRWAHVRKP